jgi:peptide/nickel transport system substrate-binding protein
MRGVTRRVRILAGAAVVAVVAGVGTVGAVSASADSASPSASSSNVVLNVGILQDIDSANPFTGVAASSYEIYQMMYPTLTNYSAKDFSDAPGMATSWTESADHLTWTYQLHPDMKWSDGVPMTAADAAYTFNRIINGKYEQTNYGNYVANITKADAPNATTLVLHVSRPTPNMTHLAVYILPEHIWKNVSEAQVQSYKNEPAPGQTIVGGGPFVLAQRVVGQYIRMVRNPNYYGTMPKINEVDFRIYSNGDAEGQALKKGEIDFADSLESNVFNSLKNVPGITTVPAIYSGFDELAFNTGAALYTGKPIGTGSPLLKDVRLRQAIAWAIDRPTIVQRVLGGLGSPGSTIIPPIYANQHLDPPDAVGYNPTKAGQMLDAAGYKMGPNNIRVSANGTPLVFRLFGRTNSPDSMKAVQYIQGYLAAVGIKANITNISEDALTQRIGEGDYDMFEWGWVVEPDPNYQLSTFTCANRSYMSGGSITANLSDSFYCNPTYDALFAKQGGQTVQADRIATVKQMQQILYDDTPYVVLYYYDDLEAYRSDRFTGFVPQPDPNGALLFQYGTYSYENVTPVSAAADSGASGVSTGLAIGLIAAVLVVAGVVVVLVRRRSADTGVEDDRE